MAPETGQAAFRTAAPRTRAGANIGGASEHNRRVVMQGLRLHGALSRAQIARETGLVPQTVSNIIEDLEAEGLVVAAEPVRSGRGQPARPYSIARHGAFAFGMQIDEHRVRAVAVDLLGEIVAGTEATLGPGGVEANLPTVLRAFEEVAGAPARLTGQPSPRRLGLGVAMPAATGVHARSDDPWMASPDGGRAVAETLERVTGLRVGMHHDASAAAVAERLTGCAKGLDSFLLLFVSYGLGAGLYVGGELHRGSHRLAGEVGLIRVPTERGPVPLEDLTALAPLYARLGLAPNQPDLADRLDRAVKARAPEVRAWVEGSARHLAWAIDTVECLIDPEAVVIAGQMPDGLMAELHQAILRERTAADPVGAIPRPLPLRGSVAPFAVAAGAAADPIARAFDPSLSALTKALG